MRAAYPRHAERLTVLNEIVADAARRRAPPTAASVSRSSRSAARNTDGAKTVHQPARRAVRRIRDMNRVCSAGTGSFLEYKAQALTASTTSRSSASAARSRRPPDLGQTCTVFVADAAAEALADGFSRDDIFAGLQYSVIKNYIGRCAMGDRPLRAHLLSGQAGQQPIARAYAGGGHRSRGRRAAQSGRHGSAGDRPAGKRGARRRGDAPPASHPAAAAEAPTSVLRRPSRTPPSTSMSFCRPGCWSTRRGAAPTSSAATCAGWRSRSSRSPGSVVASSPAATVPSTTSVPRWARSCPRTPNPYRERTELLTSLLDEAALVAAGPSRRPLAGRRIGLPQAHYLIDSLPFFATFLSALGADVWSCGPQLRPWPAATGAARRRAPARRSRSPTGSPRRPPASRSTPFSNRSSSTCRRTAPPAPSPVPSPKARPRCSITRWPASRWRPRRSYDPCCSPSRPRALAERTWPSARGGGASARRHRRRRRARRPYRRVRGLGTLPARPARHRRAGAVVCPRPGGAGRADRGRDPRRPRSGHQFGHPRPRRRQRRRGPAARLLPAGRGDAGFAHRALGRRRGDLARRAVGRRRG